MVHVATHLWTEPLKRVGIVRERSGREGKAESVSGVIDSSSLNHLCDYVIHATDEGFTDKSSRFVIEHPPTSKGIGHKRLDSVLVLAAIEVQF